MRKYSCFCRAVVEVRCRPRSVRVSLLSKGFSDRGTPCWRPLFFWLGFLQKPRIEAVQRRAWPMRVSLNPCPSTASASCANTRTRTFATHSCAFLPPPGVFPVSSYWTVDPSLVRRPPCITPVGGEAYSLVRAFLHLLHRPTNLKVMRAIRYEYAVHPFFFCTPAT